MSIKILLLKSGEDLIADVQEMMSSDDDVMGYLLNKPCVVKVRSKGQLTAEDIDAGNKETTIAMYPWMPLAKEQLIPLSTGWVVTMVTPQDKIVEMYREDVLKNFEDPNDKTNSITGPDEIGLTD